MLNELFEIILDRKKNPQPGAYTNKLLSANVDVVLQKVGEEAVEVILAAKGQGNQRLVEEVSDLIYHTFVLLAHQDVDLSDVEGELRRRHSVTRVP
jgi:phosphoribosyl-ATP pyrophosphohydrolase